MAQKVMYPGMVNSPETTITNNINESDTIIYVLDPARVPEPPNLMTLGTGTNAETVKVTEINGSAITVERGFQGVAKSWPAGTVIARNFTEYDYGALKDNIEDLDANKETPAGAQAKADATEAAAKAYADQEVADLAGEGRTTETVKGNADALAAHKAETVAKTILVTEPFDQAAKTTVNLGFRPKSVTIDACVVNTNYESLGFYDGGSSQFCKSYQVNRESFTITSGVVISLYYDSFNYIQGVVTFTNTGLEISWNIVGTLPSVSGNRRIIVSAMTHGEV